MFSKKSVYDRIFMQDESFDFENLIENGCVARTPFKTIKYRFEWMGGEAERK